MDTLQCTTPYEVITNRILALLEQGTVPWRQPWDSVTGMPRNLFRQRAYRGINVWLLTAMGYASPFWVSFRSASLLSPLDSATPDHRAARAEQNGRFAQPYGLNNPPGYARR